MARSIPLLCALALLGCRPRVDPVSTPPRVAPEAPPVAEIRACWIESKRFGPATASSLVVRHPDGDVLIDAGESIDFDDEIKPYSRKDRRWLRRLPGLLVPKVTLRRRLADAGIVPADLLWFLPTHAHSDHVGGFMQLPPVPVLLDPAEIQIVERARNEVIFEVHPAHANALSPHLAPLTYQPLAYEIYDRHTDLLRDGSVVIVPMHGHTPGSVGVFVNLPDGTRIFHVGDAANERRAIEKRRGRRKSLRRTDTDEATAHVVLAGLHDLAEAAPDLKIIPAHERAAWVDVFGKPGNCR